MTVSRRAGNPGLADILFSRIIRSRGRCEYPGCTSDGPYDTAHIIGRTYSAVRCVESNAWCMCRPHHVLVDNWAHEKVRLVHDMIDEDVYEANRTAALDGHPLSAAVFWSDEVERLKVRCVELGLDSRRRVPA